MKKILLIALLFMTVRVFAQVEASIIDTAYFVSGATVTVRNLNIDSTRYWRLDGAYEFVYLSVTDTGSTYTDSLKAYGIIWFGKTDSVFYPIDMVRIDTYTDNLASCVPNTTTKYWLKDAYLDRVFIVLSNNVFVNGRYTSVKLQGINRH